MPYYAYQAGNCEFCGEPIGLVETDGGRQRRYCSDKHRKAAHRARKLREQRHALLQYNSELRQLWHENEIDGPVLSHLQEHLIEHGKESAMHATETVILACKLLRYDLTGKGMLKR